MRTIHPHGNCFFCVFLACLFLLSACQPANTNIEITKTPMPTTPTAPAFVVRPVSSLSIDGDWLFATDAQKKGESENWFAPEYDDVTWQVVSVPHTWNVMEKYSKFNGLAWYRYHFAVPEALQDMHLRLRFQAVFYLARIWVNGVYVGEHEGGYTPFEFDVSAFLKPGQTSSRASFK